MGTKKFKGKITFKCFEFGRIDHYASKCPYAFKCHYAKSNDNDDK